MSFWHRQYWHSDHWLPNYWQGAELQPGEFVSSGRVIEVLGRFAEGMPSAAVEAPGTKRIEVAADRPPGTVKGGRAAITSD